MVTTKTKGEKKIESRVRKALFDFDLLSGVTRLAVALSGGKDSITLMVMLRAILGRGFPNLPLCAIHVDGAFSCGASVQQSFLKGICEKLEIPLIVRQSTQKRETLSCYPCSRERRSLLFEAAREWGAEAIAFGHHQDDSIETLLLNLLHKGECAGILPKVPMHHYGVTIIRPLLYTTEEMVRNFAKQSGYARITCQCPVGQLSKRMEVKSILKNLEISFPNVATNLAHAALNYGSNKALNR